MRTLDIGWNLYKKYGQTEEIRDYYGLLAIYGLGQTVYEANDAKWNEYYRSILDKYPDGVEHPHYNFECYRAGGNAKAWSMMMGQAKLDKSLLQRYADRTMEGCREKDGILCMPGMERQGAVWIDVAAAVTPFMVFVGLALEEERYMDFGAEQCFKLYEALLDEECGLLHQCRGFLKDTSLCSQDHWSRGNGWGYMALAELVKYLPADSPHRPKAERYYRDLSQAILRYQTDKGLWRQEMTEPLSWEESSGTALLLYGLGGGIRLGLLMGEEYKEAFCKGIRGLIQYGINGDFSTELSCPGCLCPGEGEQKGTKQAYMTEKSPAHNEHHSFGAFMLALVEAHRNGIREAEWKKEWKTE